MTRLEWLLVSQDTLDALRARYGGRCADCGAGAKLEFAHVSPTGLCGPGRGLRTRYFDILKNPECYVLLCRPCHRRRDSRQWIGAARAAATD